MTVSSPILLDFTQETFTSHPYSTIVSSRGAGWDRLSLSCYRIPSEYILPEYSPPHHIVCINNSVSLLEGQVAVAGKLRNIQAIPRSVGIFPANSVIEEFWNLEKDAPDTSFLDLYLEPALITQAGIEFCEQDNIELVLNVEYSLDPLIYQVAVALKTALEVDRFGSKLYADAMATALIARLISHYSVHRPIVKEYSGGLTRQQLKQVTDYIHEYLDKDLSLAELANLVQLSTYHFARLFKQSIGISPHRYHIQCRIERAKQLLLEQQLTIAEIACVVGFSSQGHLNYHFKRIVGITPRVFLQQQ